MSFFSKSTSVLGVDIGTTDLKIAQVSHSSTGKTLDTYGIVTLPQQLAGLDESKQVEIIAGILSQLLAQARVKTKRCVISLPSSSVFTTVMEIPVMNETELIKAVNYEAKKYVPLNLDEVILSWSVVSEKNQASDTQSILLTAVPKQIREHYVKLFSLADLSLEVIEIEALALIRALLPDTKKNCVIIDIGAKTTTINLVKSGFLQFSRSVNVGGDTATEQLAEVLGITKARAEQFKHDYSNTSPGLMPEVIRPILNNIKNEVRQMLALYQAKGVNADQLLFAGGGSNLPGLKNFFADLKVPIEFGDPLRNLAYPKSLETIIRRETARLTIAIGLALRA